MNLTKLWVLFKRSGPVDALQELHNHPECNSALLLLIQMCIVEFKSPYMISFNNSNQFEKNLDWLIRVAKTHEIGFLFRNWLEELEHGYMPPLTKFEQLAVIQDLLEDPSPPFVFDNNEMNHERRFLVEIGLAGEAFPAGYTTTLEGVMIPCRR